MGTITQDRLRHLLQLAVIHDIIVTAKPSNRRRSGLGKTIRRGWRARERFTDRPGLYVATIGGQSVRSSDVLALCKAGLIKRRAIWWIRGRFIPAGTAINPL